MACTDLHDAPARLRAHASAHRTDGDKGGSAAIAEGARQARLAFAVEAGPAGGSGNALKVLRSGGQVFALAIATLPSNIPLVAGCLTISARAYSFAHRQHPDGAQARRPGRQSVQQRPASPPGGRRGQTLTWTVPPVNTNCNTLVLLINLATVGAPPGKAYYFDDIQLLGTASGSGGGRGIAPDDRQTVPPDSRRRY